MDNPQRPRLSAYQDDFLMPAASKNSQTLVSASVPLASNNTFEVVRPFSVPVDFEYHAKVYRRSRLKKKFLKSIIIIGVILSLLAVALGAVGYALNRKYAGRALPYTYVGEVSIGGLTQAEISTVLQNKVSKIEVTFKEGGLIRREPLSSFGASFDYDKITEQAITGFNPFSYLTPRSFTIPASVTEREVDGYLRLNVVNKQTDPINAEIVKSKKDLIIVQEVMGFRTSTKYVVEQMNEQLSEMKNPVINLLGATDRPSVTASDLQDDIDDAKAIVGLDLGIRVWNTVVKPKQEEKLSWLEFKEVAGNGSVSVQVSQSAVREYLFGLAQKYSRDAKDEQIITNDDGTQSVVDGSRGVAIDNVDDVANKLFTAINSRQGGVFEFTMTYSDYKKVDRSNLITPPIVESEPENTETSSQTIEL